MRELYERPSPRRRPMKSRAPFQRHKRTTRRTSALIGPLPWSIINTCIITRDLYVSPRGRDVKRRLRISIVMRSWNPMEESDSRALRKAPKDAIVPNVNIRTCVCTRSTMNVSREFSNPVGGLSGLRSHTQVFALTNPGGMRVRVFGVRITAKTTRCPTYAAYAACVCTHKAESARFTRVTSGHSPKSEQVCIPSSDETQIGQEPGK